MYEPSTRSLNYVIVPYYPLLQHNVPITRNAKTRAPIFQQQMIIYLVHPYSVRWEPLTDSPIAPQHGNGVRFTVWGADRIWSVQTTASMLHEYLWSRAPKDCTSSSNAWGSTFQGLARERKIINIWSGLKPFNFYMYIKNYLKIQYLFQSLLIWFTFLHYSILYSICLLYTSPSPRD